MNQEKEKLCFCPLEGIIDIISKKWALLIVNVLGYKGKLRFSDLLRTLKGISPKTLADTLKTLEEESLIKREAFLEIPPRVEYSLTQEGIELRLSVIPILKWAETRADHDKSHAEK